MDRCYLCNYNRNKKKSGIALHRFPRDAKIRKQWFHICCLSEEVDEVKTVRICTSHFAANDVLPPPIGSLKKYPTLKFNAVPSISVPRPLLNQTDSSFPKNFGHVSQLNIISSDEFSKTFISNEPPLVVGSFKNYPLEIQYPSLVSQLPFLKNFEELPGENDVSLFVNFKSKGDIPPDMSETILPVLLQSVETKDEITTFDESSHCDSKNRIYEHPRYISEITASDLSNPKNAGAIVELVKRIDTKKSKKIRELQRQRRYLTTRVTALKNLVNQLRADVKEANKINSKSNRKKEIPITKNRIKGENMKKQKFANMLEEKIILIVE